MNNFVNSFEQEKQKINEYINKGCISGNVLITLKNKPHIHARYNINEKNLKQMYIIWNQDKEPYIIKCPVKTIGLRSYIINVKDRDRYGINNNYKEIKILKKDINKYFGYKAATSYELAFSFLLMQEKSHIISKLKYINDINLYKLFVSASEFDFLLALEIIAKELKLNYLFRIDDDTF